MSASLNPEESEEYARIIDAILATADLATITRKKVRQGLEKALGGKDLSSQKLAIKALIEARFDAISTQPSGADTIPTPSSASTKKELAATNGHGSNNEDADADGEIEVSFPIGEPAKKRKRYSSDLEDADARLAAELQAQENRMARGRSTRGGGVAKPKKKVSKKKSDKKVRAGDDSDVDASEDSGTPKKRKAGGGFQKEFNLSYPLAELVGTSQLSRPQVVKKLWEHIKANELQDPKDKRQIICDDKMQAVFKQNRVDMFQMNKLLGNQLYPLEE
ncbi:Swib mdm2 protein [Pleurostoma richardsiae]|uniref:Swib mdm2 protein n=1 Tax=Pleurostoma richardsiae TaxID=41990 RepID=A0AA38S7A8_9PEZI|nr:Swib mdm2 protein [Pleurostoma richardsiae]